MIHSDAVFGRAEHMVRKEVIYFFERKDRILIYNALYSFHRTNGECPYEKKRKA